MGFPAGAIVKDPPTNAGEEGSTPGARRSLEGEMATDCSILAWKKIPIDRGT